MSILDQSASTIRILSNPGDTISDDPNESHLVNSFVVDYEEDSVNRLVNRLLDAHGPDPTVDELIAFVDGIIPNKNYSRGFDIASQVAASGEGDCTEHAVLLAAISRAVDMPARVTFGVLLVEHENELQSFGHAWAEVHDGESWKIADATRPEFYAPGATVRYLPMLPLDVEGPGYAMSLIELAAIQPSNISSVAYADEFD